MALDRSDVTNIANLARLAIAEDNIDQYQQELSSILALVEQMNAVNTDNIQPLAHPTDAVQRLRSDQVTEVNDREKFMANAPAQENGLFLVPKVVE
ncbi:Asp-tRNA(Asn)/Glu-tRNA(Gln) amidotransferase subunit GatC [Oceaniserpentilla sp. 4NH20-0058]|uniref:Asp-tRNA(Asn)/Glu-tRNA(Gln) amidotransferase subunit GatC n=1 Tax=Oceaniserpentilla sp. 4NH20-0058 TaxID=3127660 RepID=UPI0031086837